VVNFAPLYLLGRFFRYYSYNSFTFLLSGNDLSVCTVKNMIRVIVAVTLWFSVQAMASTDDRLMELKSLHQSIKNKQVPLLQDLPLSIRSQVSDDKLRAEVFAVKAYAFPDLVKKLSSPDKWCQFITLHLNIKACVYQSGPNPSLSFFAGRKFYEPAESAFELEYRFKQEAFSNEYSKISLLADEGPFGTKDYLIVLELLKINDEVLISMSLSYQTSFSSRLGTKIYLSTIGADKIGFTRVKDENGEYVFIKGIEGIIERNVMRYYLALLTYLDTNHDFPMTESWFDATEQFSKQLHEVEKTDYLDAKKMEFLQQTRMQKHLDKGLSIFNSSSNDE